MATLFSYTSWLTETPAIRVACDYTVGTHTATSVKITPTVKISALTSAQYYGYAISARIRWSGGGQSSYTQIKAASTSQWTSPISYTFPVQTVPAAATATSATIYVDMRTSEGTSYDKTFSGSASFSAYNTAPTWPTNAKVTLNRTGVVPENVTTISATTTAAVDAQGDTITYRFRWYSGSTLKRTQTQTSRTDTCNWSNVAQGGSLYCKVDCKDPQSSYGAALTSNTVTKNKLTGASFTYPSGAVLTPTSPLTLTVASRGSNTNGNTAFTYTLQNTQGLTVYNPTWNMQGATTLSIYDTGTAPTTPYIKLSDIKTVFANNNYHGTFTLKLVTTNAYGSTSTFSLSGIQVDIRQQPTAFNFTTTTGAYTINNNDYFIINRRGVTVNWTATQDPLSVGEITYDVYASIDEDDFTLFESGQSSTYAILPTRQITYAQSCRFRVVAKTSYGTSRTITQSITQAITLHYYNTPVIEDLIAARSSDAFDLSFTLEQRSSIDDVLYGDHFYIYKESVATENKIGEAQYTGAYTSSIDVSDLSAPLHFSLAAAQSQYVIVRWTDQVAQSVFGIQAQQSYVQVPRYTPLLSVREKGVGIGDVPGDEADLMIKGAPHVHLMDALFVGGIQAHPIRFVDKMYRDASGRWRAAVDLNAGDTVKCIVFDANGIRKATNTVSAAAVVDAPVTLSGSWTYTTLISI